MSVTDKLISLGTKIDAAKTHCNEALVAKGGTEASTLWEVGDKIFEISGGGNDQQLIDLIECDITELDIPNDITKIGDYSLCYQPYLSDVKIHDGVTSIGISAFAYCEKLPSIVIPSRVTSIGEGVLQSCDLLSSVTFGENSQLEYIGMYALNGCTSLKTITIPMGVTSIDRYTFANSTLLESVILPRTLSVISLLASNAFRSTPIDSGTGYIYVPRALLSEYQSATNWSTYSAQFRAIEDYPDIVGG